MTHENNCAVETAAMKQPNCYHENHVGRSRARDDGSRISQVICSKCGAALYSTVFMLGKAPQRIVHDDIYRLLCTNQGRLELAAEALRARGWKIPDWWKLAQSAV